MPRAKKTFPVVFLPFSLGHIYLHVNGARSIFATTDAHAGGPEGSVVVDGSELRVYAHFELEQELWKVRQIDGSSRSSCHLYRGPAMAEQLQFAHDPCPRVSAECHSEDHVFEVSFDARVWLSEASDHEIIKLARCGWGFDYAADEVALFMRDRSANVKQVFAYLELLRAQKAPPGFDCSVDSEGALAWLQHHRPGIVMVLEGTAGAQQ